MRIRTLALLAFVVTLVAQPAPRADWLDKLKKKVENKVDRRVDQHTDQAIDKSLDQAENAIKCVATDQACIEKAKKSGQKVVIVDDKGQPLKDQTAAQGTGVPAAAGKNSGNAEPLKGVWANFDFVPGNRVIFADDFTRDNVGDFPRKWEFKSGNAEVVEWEGSRFIRSAAATVNGSKYAIVLPEVLPERFTLEFDFIMAQEPSEDVPSYPFFIVSFEDSDAQAFNTIQLRTDSGYLQRGDVEAAGKAATFNKNRPNRLMVLGDGRYVKVYINDKRIFNVPNANLGRSKKIWFHAEGASDEHPLYFGNVRVAASDKRLYDALAENGRVATQGIYFDTGSDRLRPESSGTLKEIGQMLKDHSDLRLLIEGHTDNVGNDTANLALSERRAAAVRQALLDGFGIDGGRLQSKGFGASKPAASNDTPEGRQNNRRVELVKL